MAGRTAKRRVVEMGPEHFRSRGLTVCCADGKPVPDSGPVKTAAAPTLLGECTRGLISSGICGEEDGSGPAC